MTPLPPTPSPPSSATTPAAPATPPWLTVGVAVAGLHLLALWGVWDGGGQQAPERHQPGGGYIPISMLTAPPEPSAPTSGASQAAPKRPDTPLTARPADPAQDSPNEPAATPAPDEADTTASATAPSHPITPKTPAEAEAADAVATADATPASPHPATAPAQQPKPASAPASSSLGYVIEGHTKGLSYNAGATLDWRQDGQRYEARMEISAFLVGSRSQTSTGSLGPDGLQPERFVDRARKERRTVFDHAQGQLRQEGSDTSHPLPLGTQDRLSVFLELALRLAALAQPPAPGHAWTIPVAGSAAVENWTFRFAGAEALSLPAGQLQAWRLHRGPLHEGDAEIDLWLAPELAFLPARIRIRQGNGDSMDQRLSRR